MTALTQSLVDYHERSKHRVNHYAPGPGGLDWATQPNPFREYQGAPQINLPLAANALAAKASHIAPRAKRVSMPISTRTTRV